MVPKQAIVYLSHVVNRTLWRVYKRLERECFTVGDVYYALNLSSEHVLPKAKGTLPVTPAQRAALQLPSRAGNDGWWMETSPSHTEIIRPGFDQAILVFRKIRPEYDFYWIIEFDVEFSGHWSKLLDAFADNASDLLCSSIIRYETFPEWGWWKSLQWPNDSKPELIRGFFPIARLSARAIDTIITAGQDGIDGFYEVVWPTILHHYGLTIEDIGGDGQFVRPANINRWYTSTLTSHTLSPGTLVARPIRFRPGARPNVLWHPVKRRFVGHVLRRLLLRVRPSRHPAARSAPGAAT
jgi:hypothetical protein